MRAYQISILILILTNLTKANPSSWDTCMGQNQCPLECQFIGYLQFMIQNCQPPIFSTCEGQKVCDPLNTDMYIQACTDYGYVLGQDGTCIAPDCINLKNCKDIKTTYCLDQGYTQSPTSCDCIFPRIDFEKKCQVKVYSPLISSSIPILAFIFYTLLI